MSSINASQSGFRPRREPRNIGAMLGPQKDRHQAKRDGGAGLAHGRKNDGCQRARGQSSGRGIAGEEGHRQPDDGEGETRRPGGGEKAAEKSRDPLPPRNPIQTGNKWPRNARARRRAWSARREMAAVKTATVPSEDQAKGSARPNLCGRCANIGRAICRSRSRGGPRFRETSQNEPERDRAAKIAKRKANIL